MHLFFSRTARLALLAATFAQHACSQADTVTLTAGEDNTGTVEIAGEIIDYTGRQITIRRPTGERSYPAERVAHIETTWPEGLQAGREALQQRDYARAAELLTTAARGDQRAWARRLAMQDLMQCYAAAGDTATAGRLAIDLARSDPTTPAIAHAPLAWFTVDEVAPATYEAWLADADSVVAQLLGASHALPTSKRAEALRVLTRLQRDPDPRVSFLALAQAWRGEIVTAQAADLERWDKRIRQAPEAVQAGAWLVLGDAHRQLRQFDQAALAYLRAEMLAARQPHLGAHALWGATRSLQNAGQTNEATRLAEQLLAECPKTAAAERVRAMLQSPAQ